MIFLPRFTVVYSTLCKLNWLNRWRMFMKLNDGLPLYNLLGLLFGIGGSALFATPHFGSIVEALLCPYCCFLVAFSLLGAYWWAGEGRMLPGLVAYLGIAYGMLNSAGLSSGFYWVICFEMYVFCLTCPGERIAKFLEHFVASAGLGFLMGIVLHFFFVDFCNGDFLCFMCFFWCLFPLWAAGKVETDAKVTDGIDYKTLEVYLFYLCFYLLWVYCFFILPDIPQYLWLS